LYLFEFWDLEHPVFFQEALAPTQMKLQALYSGMQQLKINPDQSLKEARQLSTLG
jgi:hypothetical protein